MKVVQEFYDSGVGCPLYRRTFLPEGISHRAGVVLIHGLGDHCGRYEEVMGVFARSGVVGCGADFPGNGESPGKRGHMGGVEEALAVVVESAGHLQEITGAGVPLGIAAHSMGGLLAFLTLAHYPEKFRFAWINGTLVNPAHGRPWQKAVVRAFAALFPTMTVRTGVRPALCVAPDLVVPDELNHGRVSLALGASLLLAAEGLGDEVKRISPQLRLLMTHGDEDPVCPAGSARDLFDRLEMQKKRFVSYPGLRHETFRDVGKEELFSAIGDWLELVVFR